MRTPEERYRDAERLRRLSVAQATLVWEVVSRDLMVRGDSYIILDGRGRLKAWQEKSRSVGLSKSLAAKPLRQPRNRAERRELMRQ